jgi:hypothetical protein
MAFDGLVTKGTLHLFTNDRSSFDTLHMLLKAPKRLASVEQRTD